MIYTFREQAIYNIAAYNNITEILDLFRKL